MKIITAGATYLDIDAYAGIVAYAELLQKQGVGAKAASTGTLNESIPEPLRSLSVEYETDYTVSPDDTFTIIDISDPDRLDSFVDVDRVTEVIDHHPGFEDFWQQRIGKKATIELVGAACTQVFEKWQQAGLVGQMSEASAKLLACGILDNTLNFGARITTQRDHKSYQALAHQGNLPENWPAIYFGYCQRAIDRDPVAAMLNDTKDMSEFPSRTLPVRIGQFAVWDAGEILAKKDQLMAAFDDSPRPWFINIISIGNKTSYFLCTNPALQVWLSELLGLVFHGPLAVANRLWLRKEMAKQDITRLQSK